MIRAEESALVRCGVCPHACSLHEGEVGFCHARVAMHGEVHPLVYGACSALSLDPMEKKPFRRFYPGSHILSMGGYGCNMRCRFCQNYEISQEGPPGAASAAPVTFTPSQLVEKAHALVPQNNVGIAFTYNEPGIAFEFVRDTASLAQAHGLKSAMITNGHLSFGPWKELVLHLDALNIDLKCFHEAGYESLGGRLAVVKKNITHAAERAHVEVTTLVVPGLSDGEEDMRAQAGWLSGLSTEIPLHISRYFPRFRASAPETDKNHMRRLADIAREYLQYVYLGNC